FVSQCRLRSGFESKSRERLVGNLVGNFICDFDPRRLRAMFACSRVQPVLRGTKLRRQRIDDWPPRFQFVANDSQRLPVTMFDDRRVGSAVAALRRAIAAWQL